jgi:hypothetical protein
MAIRNNADHIIKANPKNRAHEGQISRHSDSKQKWKEIPKVQVSVNMGKGVST